jgi:choline/glycine/proline betaine transport protein
MKANKFVFFTSSVLIVLFVVLGGVFSESLQVTLGHVKDFIASKFGWFYIASVAFFLFFVIWLMFSRFGRVRLGHDDERPRYSYMTWFAMLFSAGMGIGLVFFSVAEPIQHFGAPRASAPGTAAAAREAINTTLFHWGLHAWAIYVVVGLSLAYFSYRHDLPLTIRSALYPLLGRRIYGMAGNLVDVMAVFGTLFGLATSLGLGVMQVNAGLDYLGLVSISTTNQVILIAVITLMATISVVTGVDVGIRRLSELNLLMALVLLLFVFFAGPTLFLLASFVQSVGHYAATVVGMTFRTDAFTDLDWQKSWTMFYWGWWISWSPFVGMFIARVSRGRTIREFIAGVLLVPFMLTAFWMVVFGDTAIHFELFGDGGMVTAVRESIPTAIFVMLEKLPGSTISAAVATLVVTIFFVTSSDSGSLVVDILTSGGHPDPPIAQRVFWALTEGAVAAILLVAGGLTALQTAALTTALPFCVVMLLICWSLVKGLRAETATRDALTPLKPAAASNAAGLESSLPAEEPSTVAAAAEQVEPSKDGARLDPHWQRELAEVMQAHEHYYHLEPVSGVEQARERLDDFLQDQVIPAFSKVAKELEKHGRQTRIDREEDQVRLTVHRDGAEEFAYAVRGQPRDETLFAYPELQSGDAQQVSGRAEVVLRSGRRAEHDVKSFSEERIIADFLAAYDKWMGW